MANGQNLADVDLEGDKQPGVFYADKYVIPQEILSSAPNGVVTVKFTAQAGSRAGGVFDVRLVKVTP